MSDEPTSTPPVSSAPTARLITGPLAPSGDYRITESGEARDFEDGDLEQLD